MMMRIWLESGLMLQWRQFDLGITPQYNHNTNSFNFHYLSKLDFNFVWPYMPVLTKINQLDVNILALHAHASALVPVPNEVNRLGTGIFFHAPTSH